MNTQSSGDAQFQLLEARLAAAAPQLSPSEQQQLLYECAFAAGRNANRKWLRNWQIAAAGLVGMVLGLGLSLSLPIKRDQRTLVEKKPVLSTPTDVKRQPMSVPDVPRPARQSATVELNAWQVQQSESVSLADQLAQFKQTDPHLRSLSVGTFTRTVLHP